MVRNIFYKSISVFLFGFVLISPIIFSIKTKAISPTTDPNKEVIFDYECQKKVLLSTTGYDDAGKPKCNLYCQRDVIYSNGVRNDSYCKYGFTGQNATEIADGTTLFGSISEQNQYFIPQEDAALIYLRAGLYGAFGVAGLLIILYGLYGWYTRSMSGGNPDQVAMSMSIFKNAIMGGLIVVGAVVIVQIVYSVMGITQGAFDFNFIPKIGYSVDVNEIDIGRKCYSNQRDTNNTYTCVDGKWQ